MAKYPGASRRFSQEYGMIFALFFSRIRIFFGSSRLSAQAVRTIPSIFNQNERGVLDFFGSKN